jgi:hypothetical protein
MKKIDIQINQAKIISYKVAFKDKDLPDVTATIGLFAGGKQISTFDLSTESWQDKVFELPTGIIEPIKNIASELETILIRECSSAIGQLSSGSFN